MSPLKSLKSRFEQSFGSDKRLFDTTERWFKSNDLLPLVVLAIVAFSSVFAVVSFTRGLRGNETNLNRKYGSIEFAHSQRMRRQAELEERGLGGPIFSDDGEALGGKKASIQFAYDLNEQDDEDAADEANTSQGDEFDTMRLVGELEELAERELSPEQKRERLLKTMESFGHFATTKVKTMPRKRRNPKSKNLHQNPFRFNKKPVKSAAKDIVKIEDDPFTFR